MKNVFTILIVSLSMSTAFAATKTVSCVGPVGGAIASLQGELDLTPRANGQQSVSGIVRINSGSQIAVGGAYDNVSGLEYAALRVSETLQTSDFHLSFTQCCKCRLSLSFFLS